ncbi:MAG: sulfite exporter TauE/SafE family protein [Gemmatimonadaceae bacterium]|nr:sulfite exporter TauE/SafE family protein [Gemmatimonadaceae bacterium]
MAVVGFALAALIGLSLGLLGGGGSILTVPVLVYVLGYEAKQAIVMSLVVVGITSLVGAVGHWRAGNVNLRSALIFGVITMIGSYLGARLAVLFTGGLQLALLAVVMLAAAASMFRAPQADPTSRTVPPPTLPLMTIGVVGLLVGVLTGVVGIGGGFLIVPALVLLGQVPVKEAIGTSLLVIAMNSASGYLGYIGTVMIPTSFLMGFTAVAVGGILVGTHLVRYVSAGVLKRSFAVFLLVMGGFMLYQNRLVIGR